MKTSEVREDTLGRPLLKAKEVGEWLNVSTKRVYELDIPHMRVAERTLRWDPLAVAEYLDGRKNKGR